MVDHRADEEGNFSVYTTQNRAQDWSWADFRARLTDWFAGRGPAERRLQPARRTPSLAPVQLATAVSAVWLMALGAYGVGYFLRPGTDGGGDRLLPTLDFMFFGFAVIGPIAMIWLVVTLLARAQRLSDAIVDQSEAALALATAVSTLNDSVDAVSASTSGRLEQACDRMERQSIASADKLDRVLADVAQKVDTTMLDGVIMLDKSNRDRLRQVEAALAEERGAFANRLDSDARDMARKIDQNAADSKRRLDQAVDSALAAQGARLNEAHSRLEASLAKLSDAVLGTVDGQMKTLDSGLREHLDILKTAADATARTIENDLVKPIGAVRRMLEETAEVIAARPPATAEDLATLIADSAQTMIRPDRQALQDSIERITELETQAQSILVQLDRTSRLNPALSRTADAPAPAPDPAASPVTELPFAQLPRSATRRDLNWTAVALVLDRSDPRPGTKHALETAAADPDVAALMANAGGVEDAMAQDGLYLGDLRPEHAPADLWARFAKGERGGAITELAGLPDDVAPAIVRARLRRDPEFRALALRFAAGYVGLLERAVAEIDADQRLVELAETQVGRAFILMADVLGMFERKAPMADAS